MDQRDGLPTGKILSKRSFFSLLIIILAMLVIAPLVNEFVHLRIILDIFWSAIFIAAIYAVSHKKLHLIIGILLALPMLGSFWSKYFFHHTGVLAFGSICGAAFFCLAIFHILVFIYNQKRVSKDLIVGAALVYFLMALAWTFVIGTVELLHPGSYAVAQSQGDSGGLDFLYYSFVTMTTLGYGDIVPTTKLARSLCILEAVIGQLYLVVSVAWLVGMHVSQSMMKRSK
jgi:voltage-gated potassium channel